MTQKDIHNILVKADDVYKAHIMKYCDCDIEKIKKFEQQMADIINIATETIGEAWGYMNEEIK